MSNDVLDKIEQIETDFRTNRGPFADVTFPEERLLDELGVTSMEDKLAAISLFSTLDYNRDANQLVDKIIEVVDRNGFDVFNPYTVKTSEGLIEHVFEEISFRYPSRDAHAWHKNCSILVDKYNAKWHELVMDTGMDAPSLVKRLEEDDFNVLKGVKIAPMYARIIDDEVAPLDRVWELDIPIDVHIRRLSKDLFGYSEDYDVSDDRLREDWRDLAKDNNIDRHVVDGAMWQVGNNWDSWGEDYWEGL